MYPSLGVRKSVLSMAGPVRKLALREAVVEEGRGESERLKLWRLLIIRKLGVTVLYEQLRCTISAFEHLT